MRPMTRRKTCAISLPLGRLPGRIMANTGLPEPASKISIGLKQVVPAWLLKIASSCWPCEVVGIVDVEHDALGWRDARLYPD